MTNKRTGALGAGVVILLLAGSAQATLIDRGGGMIYDSEQKLTWLQDANYAQTSGHDTDGLMNWGNATSWAAGLSYGGYSDWRLPTITDNGNDGCNWGNSGTDCGYNTDTTGSELGYMWYDILGNIPYYNTSGSGPQAGWGLTSTGADGVDFLNLQSSYFYWSGTEYVPRTYYAWLFNTGYGLQSYGYKYNEFYAWVVRDGDVAGVSEPATVLLFGLGLAGLVVARRGQSQR
ncbi:MAG: DUF1566 domain-containing protein [Gammaproteobacteria bacterium]|nr:DUF1566 domain-containing protein [Gammaproteobacteria bacterium]